MDRRNLRVPLSAPRRPVFALRRPPCGRPAALEERGGTHPVPAARGFRAHSCQERHSRTQKGIANVPVLTSEVDELAVARHVLIEALGREERLMLLLFYADGLSFAEVADVLGLTERAVGRLYRETMDIIRERLG